MPRKRERLTKEQLDRIIRQMRHADIATTLRVYTHAIPQSQRDAMEGVNLQSVEANSRVLKFAAK